MTDSAGFIRDYLGSLWLIIAVWLWGGAAASGGSLVCADKRWSARTLRFTVKG